MRNNYLHIFIIVIGIVFISLSAFHTNIWFDESYSVALVTHSFQEVCQIATTDVHPPLYYLMLKVLNLIFGTNILVYRLFSIIPIAILGIIGFTHIRKDFGGKVGVIFSFLVLFLPGITRYATEIRMYSWAMLFVGITSIYAYRLYKEFNIKNLVIFGIFSLLSAYTHYYGLMIAGIINLILFIYLIRNSNNNKKELKQFLICALIQVILYIPWLIYFLKQIGEVSKGFWIGYTFPDTLMNIISVPLSGNNIDTTLSFILITFLYIYIFILLYKEKKTKGKIILPLLGIVLYFIIIVIAHIISAIMTPIILERYMLVVLVPLIFSFSFLLAKEKNMYITVIVCGIIFGVSLINNIQTIKVNYNKNNKEMIEYVEENLKENDKFVIYHNAIVGFSVTTKYLEHTTYFHDESNWNKEKAYQAFGPNIVFEHDIDKIMEKVDGRIWIINIPKDEYEEKIASKYNIKLLERKEFNIAYDNSYFSFTIIQK